MSNSISERVSAGISLLDEQVPNWRNRIDWGALNLESGSTCILGQLFRGVSESFGTVNGYHEGCLVLGISSCGCCRGDRGSASMYGFDLDEDECAKPDETLSAIYAELAREWLRQTGQ